IVNRASGVVAVTLGWAVSAGSCAWSQETGKPKKDDALDSLLEKLAGPADGPPGRASRSPSDKPNKAKAPQSKPKVEEPAARAQGKPKPGAGSAPAGDRAGKVPAPKPGGSTATVAPKDQELDELLQKLGETKETPSPDDRPRQGG